MGGELYFTCARPRRSINLCLVAAFPVPVGNDAKCSWPIRGVLPDWRIPVVHQLIAVVFELLSKVIQHGPSFMTGGTAQAVFPGKCRNCVGLAGGSKKEKEKESQQSGSRTSRERSHLNLLVGLGERPRYRELDKVGAEASSITTPKLVSSICQTFVTKLSPEWLQKSP